MMIANVRGAFSGVSGTVVYDPDNVGDSTVNAEIDVSTIKTFDDNRDAHLKSAEFFDVEKYPTLTFSSTRVTREGDDQLRVEGDLTIHGVTRKVAFLVEGPSEPNKDAWGNLRIGLSATTRINRKDFGLASLFGTWMAQQLNPFYHCLAALTTKSSLGQV